MKDFLLKYSWAGYLGFALSCFLDINLDNWQFWAILVPMAILVAIKGDK